jgi:hypothetical protein
MKKACTLLAAIILTATAAVAQNRNHDNNYENGNPHDVAINDNHSRGRGYDDGGSRYFNERERDMRIEEINREYYKRLQSVRNKFFMSRQQKERIINSLQFQREKEIRSVIAKFNQREYRYDKRDGRYDDHDKRNWK